VIPFVASEVTFKDGRGERKNPHEIWHDCSLSACGS
jgi:hypothetical protein